MTVPKPAREALRLARLRAMSVLDTGPEALFDGLAEAAAMALGMPIAAVNLIDADRQWTQGGRRLRAGAPDAPRRGLLLLRHPRRRRTRGARCPA